MKEASHRKTRYCMIWLIWIFQKRQIHRDGKETADWQAQGTGTEYKPTWEKFVGWWTCSKTGLRRWSSAEPFLKSTELCTYSWWTLQYVSDISKKLCAHKKQKTKKVSANNLLNITELVSWKSEAEIRIPSQWTFHGERSRVSPT